MFRAVSKHSQFRWICINYMIGGSAVVAQRIANHCGTVGLLLLAGVDARDLDDICCDSAILVG